MTDERRERLRTTFDQNADLYDRARPRYPEQAFDDIVALAALRPDAHLLEIGCGTGRATLPLARRSFPIVCVELGESLAAVARRNLAAFPGVRVVTSPFETWDPGGASFDLVYAAASWHWLDPDVRYRKAASVLNPGGHLAIFSGGHAFPSDADRFFFEIQDIYRKIGEDIPGEQWPPPLPEDVPDLRDEIEGTRLFGEFQSRRYVWEQIYTVDEYIALLNTFSGHIAMEPEKRNFLYKNVRERIDARPEKRVRRHWLTILNVARKTPAKPTNP